jgi:hypothetical protein
MHHRDPEFLAESAFQIGKRRPGVSEKQGAALTPVEVTKNAVEKVELGVDAIRQEFRRGNQLRMRL